MRIDQSILSGGLGEFPGFTSPEQIAWPKKYDLFGVGVSSTTYSEVTEILILAAKCRRPTLVDFTPVSVLSEASANLEFRSRLNSFDLVCPDGQPVRWCLNYFYKARLRERVCGTTAMLLLCEAAAHESLGVYLYGSTPDTLQKLQTKLVILFPQLRIVGAEAPPFRPLTTKERSDVVRRIHDSGAGFVFVGLGSPKQEAFAWEQRLALDAVQLCVGAAYDFIAGTKRRAPLWMQKTGLEWLHRVLSEPARLGRRYVVGNARFVALVLGQMFAPKRG